VKELQEYILEGNHFIPLWQENVTPFWSPSVQNMLFDVSGVAAYSNASKE